MWIAAGLTRVLAAPRGGFTWELHRQRRDSHLLGNQVLHQSRIASSRVVWRVTQTGWSGMRSR